MGAPSRPVRSVAGCSGSARVLHHFPALASWAKTQLRGPTLIALCQLLDQLTQRLVAADKFRVEDTDDLVCRRVDRPVPRPFPSANILLLFPEKAGEPGL